MVVHVDDFLVSWKETDLEWLAGELANTFDFSKVILENTSLDKHEAKHFNQITRWTTDNKVEYEANPHHAEILLREWGLAQCRPNTVPTTKAMVDQIADGGSGSGEGSHESSTCRKIGLTYHIQRGSFRGT